MAPKQPWYKRSIGVIAMLIVFFPAGLFLMWKYTSWNKVVKWSITGVLAFLLLVNMIASGPSSNSTKPSPTPTPAQVQVKSINYEVTKIWDIPNGGHGKDIVISPENLNEADMTLLGSQLKSDVKNDRNSFIFIFTGRKAAEIKEKNTDINNLSIQEQDMYDKNFVGTYTKNANSGYNEFVIYLDGIMGSSQKTIKY